MVRATVFGILAIGLVACNHHAANPDAGQMDAPLAGYNGPELVCPGGPGCATTGDGQLKVGAGAHAYTPMNFETYTDENNDHQWEPNEPYTDLNGNGVFDAVWLFGGGRAAELVDDDVEARALAFVEGDVTAVVLYIDCIGMLSGDMDIIRNDPKLAGLDIDHIIIGATHAHDAPDTVGLWGATATSTGREPFVMNAVYAAAVDAIYDAVTTAQPAQMQIATTLLINDPANPQSKTDMFNEDIRDPVIFDPTLTIARFVQVADPTMTIGTLVNYADHPEVAHFSKTEPASVTAHYVHWLRLGVENGVKTTDSIFAQTDLPGIGGITVFVQGALGGQIGSIRTTMPPGPDGTPITDESHAEDQAIGTNAAAKALTALQTAETVSDMPLSFVTATFNAELDNILLQTAFLIKLLGPHPLIGYDPNQALGEGNNPWLPLRSTYLQIGPLGMVTVPGELHPELWVGGYDGADWTWGWPLYDTTKPNPPLFDQAPQPPYMRDLVMAHGVRYPIVAGLAEDYIGYIVPAYNYVLDPVNPYLVEATGDHYEEVYSLGPNVEAHAIHPILQMLQSN